MTRPTDAAARKAAILDRLRQGPARMSELLALSPSGYRQRISDLRKEGYVIPAPDRSKGESIFWLEQAVPGEQLSLLTVAA